MDSPKFQQFQQFFDQNLPRYLNLLQEMVAINSFTLNAEGVRKVGERTAAAFAEIGFSAEYVPAENPAHGPHLFLKRSGSGKNSVMFVSHLDTVFTAEEEARENFRYRPAGDKIYGPGVIDIKGGTVLGFMMLEALRHFQPEYFESVNWIFALNAAEEVFAPDFPLRCIERGGKNCIACLVFELGNINGKEINLVTSRAGRATFGVKAIGRSAHSGNNHHLGANAIHELARVIPFLQSLTDYEQRATCNVGVIRGGTARNRVPHEAELQMEFRCRDIETYEQLLSEVRSVEGPGKVKSNNGDFTCRIVVNQGEGHLPWPGDERTEGIFKVWEEAAAEAGYQAVREARGGLSDANNLWQSFPTIDGLGPGGDNDHCSEQSADGRKEQEYLWLPTFTPKAALNTLALLRLLEQSAG